MRIRSIVVPSLGAALASALAWGQAGQLLELAETYQRNREELRHYSWVSRTEVVIDGELEETTQVRLRFDADGEVAETTGTDPDDERPDDRSRKRRSRKKAGKAAELSEDLRELIRSYTRFTPEQMDSVFDRASVFPGRGGAEGTIRIEVRSVVREGDSMTVWADSFSKRLRKTEIMTSLEGEPVKVATVFRDLPEGPTYPAETTVETEVKGKATIITMENLDYARRDD